MRIRKVSQTTPTTSNAVNEYSTSTENTYGCNYINNLNTYSTTEHRIGTWINRKTNLQKSC